MNKDSYRLCLLKKMMVYFKLIYFCLICGFNVFMVIQFYHILLYLYSNHHLSLPKYIVHYLQSLYFYSLYDSEELLLLANSHFDLMLPLTTHTMLTYYALSTISIFYLTLFAFNLLLVLERFIFTRLMLAE